MSRDKKVSYLRNRDLLRNIHLSKSTYTWYIDGTWRDTKYRDYDIIVCDEEMYEQSKSQMILQAVNRHRLKNNQKKTTTVSEEDLELLTQEDFKQIEERLILFKGVITDKILRLAKEGKINRLLYEDNKKRVSVFNEDEINAIDDNEVVVRVFTYEHIPDNSDKNTKKTNKLADTKMKVNFPPYKHYAIVNGETCCVAISHFDGNAFNLTHGRITDPLALGFITLCNRIATSYNWCGYTYTDDMKGNALVQLTNMGLQFNELFSNNPFSYYTSTVNNAFTVIFNDEFAVQQHRDKVLRDNDFDPSYTEQLKHELTRTEYWERVLGNKNMRPSEVSNVSVSELAPSELEDIRSIITKVKPKKVYIDEEELNDFFDEEDRLERLKSGREDPDSDSSDVTDEIDGYEIFDEEGYE